ncbi:MAG TPA: TIGR04076 family protein [Firmicutes bacterium]|nr:TIGR04076 family protein [Bacillota bacterium]
MKNIRVRVSQIKGHCSAGLKVGDGFTLLDGTVIADVKGPLCLYALNAISGYLTGQAFSQPGSGWVEDVARLQCPDVANAVVFEIKKIDGA